MANHQVTINLFHIVKSSLNIDLFFFAALNASEPLKQMVGKRIFHTFRDSTAEKEDKIPYLIVTADEANSANMTKDDAGIDPLNTATCSVLCVAKTPDALAELTTEVLNAVNEAYTNQIWEDHEDWNFEIYGISPQADVIEADPDKPCLFRWMHFQCEI